ncbi:SDR family oxidoreductase [Nonomuraea diastatica]|uniref:SDR family oxidoreductase n=1 Tax=Nonomuraea diastatica TaxID=1848329 RepID=A0A4R4V698_9ACTN|nr:SDR family oxidoreductase [Nonomuraea diastatica]TDD00708.1 SDR family oxidoreductase [Nonomuraea diastatica]
MRVALITGGGRGIGRAIALRLAADGANVVVNYRSDVQAAKQVAAAVENLGGQAAVIRADVADPEQLRALFDTAEGAFGGLDVFVHNAFGATLGPLALATDEDYAQNFATNSLAAFVAFREAATRLRDGGRIVYVSTAITRVSNPGSSLYSASKAAGEQLVRVLAREVAARGITVNSVLPGPVDTDSARAIIDQLTPSVNRTPFGRIGEPEDIADVVAFLASDQARWITGQRIVADGGLTA